jgi:hypothetical protein
MIWDRRRNCGGARHVLLDPQLFLTHIATWNKITMKIKLNWAKILVPNAKGTRN